MKRTSLLAVSAVMAAWLAAAGDAEASGCPDMSLPRERAAFASLMKSKGVGSKQVVMNYADARVRAWRSSDLNERGRACGVQKIGAMMFGCMRDEWPALLASAKAPLSQKSGNRAFEATVGVKNLTVGQQTAIVAISTCQMTAIEIFAR